MPITQAMRPIQIDPALLRLQVPELVIRPGMTVVARVAERGPRLAMLMLAGLPLTAELPAHVRVGETLRLRVQEATHERVVMRIVPEGAAPEARPADQPQRSSDSSPLLTALSLPNGASAEFRVGEREADGGTEGESSVVSFVFRSTALGAIDFRVALEGGAVTARVQMVAGGPAEAGSGALSELRSMLARGTGRPAQVQLSAKRNPVNTYV
ncbi:MAG: hypothetical protein ACJ76V_09255 [Thermoleophilaceae bacterium]